MDQARTRQDILTGVIWKQLLIFFWPILIGTFFQQLYNTADAVIVGNVLGREALAAVGGTTGNLINLLVGFFVGLSSGATVLISQTYGAGRYEEVGRSVHTAIALALAFGAALTLFGLLSTTSLLSMIGTPEDVMPYAARYMRVVFLGMIPTLVYNMATGVLRAIGDSKHPLYALAAACMVNIALDLILVAGLRMGTEGAALATVLSQVIACALVVHRLRVSDDCTALSWRKIAIDPALTRRVLRIGLPAGLQSVMYAVSNVLIQAAINGFPTAFLAGWTAYGKLDGMFWMIMGAFGIAVTTFAGQNWGAGNYERVRRAARVCGLMALIATLLLVALLIGFGNGLIRLFTGDPEVIVQGTRYVRLLAPFFVTAIPIEILSGTLRGTGDTLTPTLMTLLGICATRVLWILFVAPRIGGIVAVISCYPLTWALTGGLYLLYYSRHSEAMRMARLAAAQRRAEG